MFHVAVFVPAVFVMKLSFAAQHPNILASLIVEEDTTRPEGNIDPSRLGYELHLLKDNRSRNGTSGCVLISPEFEFKQCGDLTQINLSFRLETDRGSDLGRTEQVFCETQEDQLKVKKFVELLRKEIKDTHNQEIHFTYNGSSMSLMKVSLTFSVEKSYIAAKLGIAPESKEKEIVSSVSDTNYRWLPKVIFVCIVLASCIAFLKGKIKKIV